MGVSEATRVRQAITSSIYPDLECGIPLLALAGVPALGLCDLAHPQDLSPPLPPLHLPSAGHLLPGTAVVAVCVQSECE